MQDTRDRFYARLRSGGAADGGELSPRTVRLCHTVVTQTLDQARRWGLVARNVAGDATVPKSRKGDIDPPSAEALRHLLVSAADVDAEFGLYLRVLGGDRLPPVRGAGAAVDRRRASDG